MHDLKPRRPRANPLRFVLILLTLLLLGAALAPWLGERVRDVFDRQFAVWDAQDAAWRQTLAAETTRE